MKNILDLFRMIIISGEIAIVLISFLFFLRAPVLLSEISKSLFEGSLPITTIPWALIFVYVGTTITSSKSLLFPKENNRTLLNWSLYPALYRRAIFAIIWTSLSGLITVIIMIFKSYFSHSLIGFIYISVTASSLLSAITIILANFKVRYIIEKNLND